MKSRMWFYIKKGPMHVKEHIRNALDCRLMCVVFFALLGRIGPVIKANVKKGAITKSVKKPRQRQRLESTTAMCSEKKGTLRQAWEHRRADPWASHGMYPAGSVSVHAHITDRTAVVDPKDFLPTLQWQWGQGNVQVPKVWQVPTGN